MLNLKICIIGDELTGKSSICDRYVYDSFSSKYEETVGINYKNRILEQKDNLININCWDISGNDNYIEIRNEFYKDCHAILVVFDLTTRKTFDNIKKWI
jgi:small GTP-binding protein